MKKPRAYYLIAAIGLIFILEFIGVNMNDPFNTAKASINDVADEETESTIIEEAANYDELLEDLSIIAVLGTPKLTSFYYIEDEIEDMEETNTEMLKIPQMYEVLLEEIPDVNDIITYEEIDPEPEKINYEEFIPLPNSATEELIKDCTDRNIPLYIGLGLIEVESDFDSSALSKSNCYGFCQLNPRFFPSDLSNEDNIWYGMAYLEENYIKYNDWTKALNAYNKGQVTGDLVYPTLVFQRAAKWKQILIEHGIDLVIDSIAEVE